MIVVMHQFFKIINEKRQYLFIMINVYNISRSDLTIIPYVQRNSKKIIISSSLEKFYVRFHSHCEWKKVGISQEKCLGYSFISNLILQKITMDPSYRLETKCSSFVIQFETFDKILGCFYGKQYQFQRSWEAFHIMKVLDYLKIENLKEMLFIDIFQNFQEYDFFVVFTISWKFGNTKLKQKCKRQLKRFHFQQININKYDLMQCDKDVFEQIIKLHQQLFFQKAIKGLGSEILNEIIDEYSQEHMVDLDRKKLLQFDQSAKINEFKGNYLKKMQSKVFPQKSKGQQFGDAMTDKSEGSWLCLQEFNETQVYKLQKNKNKNFMNLLLPKKLKRRLTKSTGLNQSPVMRSKLIKAEKVKSLVHSTENNLAIQS